MYKYAEDAWNGIEVLEPGPTDKAITGARDSTIARALWLPRKTFGLSLLTGGASLAYYALKKLVDDSYRAKLQATLKNRDEVEDTYKQKDNLMENKVLGVYGSTKNNTTKSGQYKEASWFDYINPFPWLYNSAGSLADTYIKKPVDNMMQEGSSHTKARSFTQFKSPALAGLVRMYGEHPITTTLLSSLLLGGSLPVAWWGGKALTKALLKPLDYASKSTASDDEVNKAKKEYEEAAKALQRVTRDDLHSEKKANFIKSSADNFGNYMHVSGPEGYQSYMIVPNDKTVDPLFSTLVLGAGGLLTTLGGWRFMKGLQKGYNRKAEEVSDATRSIQAWQALQQARDMNVTPYRVELESTEGLPDFLLSKEDRKKRRKKRQTKAE